MNAFEAITLIVALAAIAIALSSYMRLGRVLDELGRRGSTWFDHSDDMPLADRPNEDDNDAPLPRRPVRARPE